MKINFASLFNVILSFILLSFLMLNDIFPKPSAFKHGKIVYFEAIFLNFIKRPYKEMI